MNLHRPSLFSLSLSLFFTQWLIGCNLFFLDLIFACVLCRLHEPKTKKHTSCLPGKTPRCWINTLCANIGTSGHTVKVHSSLLVLIQDCTRLFCAVKANFTLKMQTKCSGEILISETCNSEPIFQCWINTHTDKWTSVCIYQLKLYKD